MTGMSFAPTADIPLSLTHALIFSRQLSTLSTGLSTAQRFAGRERRCAAPILRRICPQFVAERKLIHFSTDLSTIRMHYAPFYAYETAAARHRNAGCRTTKPAVLRKTAQKSGKQTAEKLLRAFRRKGLCKRNRRFMQESPLYAGMAPIEKRVFCRISAMQKRSGGRRFCKSHSESIRTHNFVRHLVAGLVGR